MSSPSLASLRSEVQTLADPGRAEILQGYFKTGPGQYGEGDRFLGLRVPQLRQLAREYRALGREEVLELLRSAWHEERLLALLILVEQYRKGEPAEREEIHRTYLANTALINNWDLVDSSAEQIVGAHLDPGRIEVLEALARSESLWERRIAVIATFQWIRRGIFRPTLLLSEILLRDRHDLIHKAVGWMLREVGKRTGPARKRSSASTTAPCREQCCAMRWSTSRTRSVRRISRGPASGLSGLRGHPSALKPISRTRPAPSR